jgi:hypothetical protein
VLARTRESKVERDYLLATCAELAGIDPALAWHA